MQSSRWEVDAYALGKWRRIPTMSSDAELQERWDRLAHWIGPYLGAEGVVTISDAGVPDGIGYSAGTLLFTAHFPTGLGWLVPAGVEPTLHRQLDLWEAYARRELRDRVHPDMERALAVLREHLDEPSPPALCWTGTRPSWSG